MTKCGVCGINPSIGVACTVMPYNTDYCVDCARRNAQPNIVFECFYQDHGTDFDKIDPAYLLLETFLDGKYVNYATWAAWRSDQISADA